MSLLKYIPASFGSNREPKPVYDTIKYGMLYNRQLLDEFHADPTLIISSDMITEGWRIPVAADYDINLIEYLYTVLSTDVNNVGHYVRLNRIEPQVHPRWNTNDYPSINSSNFNWLPCGEFATQIGQPVQGAVAGLGGSIVTLTINFTRTYIRRFRLSEIPTYINFYESNFVEEPMLMYGGTRLIREATLAELSLPDFKMLQPYIGATGIKYPTVKIGNYVWLAWNLADRKYTDGNWLPGGNELLDVDDFINITTPYCVPPLLDLQLYTDPDRWLNVM